MAQGQQDLSEIKASARTRAGTGGAREVRRQAGVPAIIYGNGGAPQSVALPSNELVNLINRGRFLSKVIELDVDGAKTRVIPREVQVDPVNGKPVHVDFQRVDANSRIRVERAGAVRQRGAVAGPEARRRAEHRAPRGGGDLPGRCHPRGLRVQPGGPGDRPLAAHLGHHRCRGRGAHHQGPRLHGRHHRRPQDRRGGRSRYARRSGGRGRRARGRRRALPLRPMPRLRAAKAPAGKDAGGAKGGAAAKPAAAPAKGGKK